MHGAHRPTAPTVNGTTIAAFEQVLLLFGNKLMGFGIRAVLELFAAKRYRQNPLGIVRLTQILRRD